MGKQKKTMERLLGGRADAHLGFAELRKLLLSLGFEERIRGSHHLFSKRGIVEKINLQRDGRLAKPYQVRQVRAIILTYRLMDQA